jgi:hypothetical protein
MNNEGDEGERVDLNTEGRKNERPALECALGSERTHQRRILKHAYLIRKILQV